MKIGTNHHEFEITESDDEFRVSPRQNGKLALSLGWQHTISGTPDALEAFGRQILAAVHFARNGDVGTPDDLNPWAEAS